MAAAVRTGLGCGERRAAVGSWRSSSWGTWVSSPPAPAYLPPATSPSPCPQFVEDPYTKARFQPECEGQVSPVGDVARIGLEASGLVSFPGQQR